jgi:molybdopterin molybdotransferase
VIPVDKALEIVLGHTPVLPAEEVDLPSAVGRVLAEDIHADLDMPPFDRSAMDGYAVRAADVAHAPVVLDVAGQVRAGHWPERGLEPGQAIQIMTGAPVPSGATAVQPVEKTRPLEGGRRVEMLAPVEPGAHIARQGAEARAGDRLLERGRTVDPASVAVLASAGKGRLRVGRRPTLAMLVTGDELVDVWDTPTRGRIRNSNGYAVLAQARWAGAEARSLGVVPDLSDRIAEAVRDGFGDDVLVISGGVSEGAYDLVEEVLARFDVGLLFTKVAIKPGAPLVFGRRGDKLVFGLPGNPVSAMVTFHLLARPALRALAGAEPSDTRAQAVLDAAVRQSPAREQAVRCRVRAAGDGWHVEPTKAQGSHVLTSMLGAGALALVPPGEGVLEAGARVDVELLPRGTLSL